MILYDENDKIRPVTELQDWAAELELDEEQRIEDIKQGRDDAIAGRPLSGQSYDYYTSYTKEHLTAALNLLGGKDEPI